MLNTTSARLGALASFVIMTASGPSFAGTECRAASAAVARPLVELYTSEGCDSCPPADRWLAGRFPAGDPGAGAVPLAFHVDYWDRLGWRDRFATPAYTARQYEAMRENRSSFVYTPEVLVQGVAVRQWREDAGRAIESALRKPARATIGADATVALHEVRLHVVVEVADAPDRRDAKVFAAYADNGLVSEIRSGENRGVRLVHAHVVRALTDAGAVDAAGVLDAHVTLERPAEAGTDAIIVVFVQRESNGDVLQALALPLGACAVRSVGAVEPRSGGLLAARAQCTTCASSPER